MSNLIGTNNAAPANTRKTKNSAKAAESAVSLAKSPGEDQNLKSPTDMNTAFHAEGSSFRKEMAGMQEVLKSNNFLREAFSENLSMDEKFSLVISELYRIKKANEATEKKYTALVERFQTHEDTIRQTGASQEDAFQEATGRITGTEANIVDLHQEAQNLSAQIGELSLQMESTSRDINLLKGFSDKFEKQFDLIRAKTTAMMARSMDKNLLFSGISKSKKENCKASVANFITNKMNIKVMQHDIKFAYRQGKFVTGKIRPIVARVPRALRDIIMKNKDRLKKLQKDTGEQYYVNIQLPDAMVAERKALQYELKRIKKFNDSQKDEEDKLQFHVKNNQLYVEDQLQEQEIYPPHPTELFAAPKEQELMDNMALGMSQPKTKGGSVFVGLAIPVQTLKEVNRAYRKVRQMYPSYDHVMMAYKIKDFSGYQDDGEHSAGIKLHALIGDRRKTRLALFVARNFGGSNLGPLRFSYILEVANQAIDWLLEIGEFVPAPLPPVPEQQDSQTKGSPEKEQASTGEEGTSSPFPSSLPPQEEWPSADSSVWEELKTDAMNQEENFETPDEENSTAEDDGDFSSSDEEQSQNDTVVKTKV